MVLTVCTYVGVLVYGVLFMDWGTVNQPFTGVRLLLD